MKVSGGVQGRHANEHAFRQAEQRLWQAAGAVPTERRVHLANDEIGVRVQEVGEGPATLFIHGGPGAAGSIWAFLVAHLSQLRCIVVDRPGTGLSDPLPLNATTMRPHSERFVPDLLDALELDKAHLVGSSHGSYIALVASLRYPDRVDRTIHMGCPGFVEGMAVSAMDRLILWPGMAWLFSRMPVNESELRKSIRRLGHGVSLDAGRIPQVLFDWSMAVMKCTPTMREELRFMARLGTIRGFYPSITIRDEELAAVRSPTLLYWGEHDPYGGPELARRLASVIPDTQLELIEGAGHLPWVDDPERAAAAVYDFLGVTGSSRVRI
jgi:pimeloyl-ACP methyl ester carboxylesterase